MAVIVASFVYMTANANELLPRQTFAQKVAPKSPLLVLAEPGNVATESS